MIGFMAKNMIPVETSPFAVKRRTGDLAEGAAALGKELASTPVATVLGLANRFAIRRGPTTAFGQMKPRPVDWFCFDTADSQTLDWRLRGITSGSDSGSGKPPALVAGWHWNPERAGERGTRLTFLNPMTSKYRHVLLVAARQDGNYGAVGVHASGLAWVGDLLYVADSGHGLRVFDMNQILDLRSGQADVGDRHLIGRHKGRSHAYGYRYVMPQVDAWQVVTPGVRLSFVTADRSADPGLLVSGECGDTPGRVARWPLAADGSLASVDGVAVAADAFRAPEAKIQGAVSYKSRWYLSQAGTGTSRGRLLVCAGSKTPLTRPFPYGPEDLTVWREKSALWSVTDFPGRRTVFGVEI
jgi:hypothetical protein